LALYEALMRRIETTIAAQRKQDQAAAQKHLALCRIGVAGLASALDTRGGDLAANFLRLYSFLIRCLEDATEQKLRDALGVLRTLHESFVAIRPQALAPERGGEIPPLEQAHSFQTTAKRPRLVLPASAC
jgi:flagellin-specific chaperone FliS